MLKNKAFTLVEIIVVIAIIIIMTGITMPRYNSMRQQLALQRAASKMVQDIRRVQEMAMSAERKGDECAPPGPTNFHYAFGLSFSTSTNCSQPTSPCRYRYVLFTDCNGNNTYQWNPDDDYVLELPDFSQVQISSIDGFSSDIIFLPPDPITIFDNDANITQGSIVISLRDDPTKTKTITVNKAGLVTIE